jgi:hypothetical protein
MAVARPIVPRIHEPAASWVLPGAWRSAGRHRDTVVTTRRRRKFPQVIAGMRTGLRTMTSAAGRHGWSLAWPVAFVVAGFTVNRTVGWVVVGLACLLMDLRTTE